MASIDVFSGDAFTMMSLTTMVESVPYRPSLLGQLGLFNDVPIRTKVAAIEVHENGLALIASSTRGGPLPQQDRTKRTLISVQTPRLAKGDTIFADEIANIRAHGSETELMGVQEELARRALRLRQDLEFTFEHHRLGAIQGIVYDANGTTALYNWPTIMGKTLPNEIDFELDDAATDVRKKCATVVRQMLVAAGGSIVPGAEIVGLCGDNFFDAFVGHANVRGTYLNTPEAEKTREGTAFQQARFGGITFINYRGSDTGSVVAINTDKVKFFPLNASPDLFQRILSPAESAQFVNTPGRELYAMQIPDRDRDMYTELEIYSYPLHVCTKPQVLSSGKKQ